MVICGIKLTHDGAVALIDNGNLKFSVEMEKIENRKRYSSIDNVRDIEQILKKHGYDIDEVDRFVIDGWHGSGQYWNGPAILNTRNELNEIAIQVAPYNENSLKENILERFVFNDMLPIGKNRYNYSSYMHVAGHVMSAYCTSPFARQNKSSFVLIWDGGQYPRLYYFNAQEKTIINFGHLFLFLGMMYSVFAQYFGPYKKTEAQLAEDKLKMEIEGFFGGYSVAGKIMSYIAFGKERPELLTLFEKVRKETIEISNQFAHHYSKKLRQLIDPDTYSDEDVLASFHVYLQNLLLDKLAEKIKKYPSYENNLCFAGGCALNIKWNSKIRCSGLFKNMYVPPFPNDSGSAIGMACCEYLLIEKKYSIKWSVYSGPMLEVPNVMDAWTKYSCSVNELARHLYDANEPVIFLNGFAELGPRALGNRSILASPINKRMKDLLNIVKKRESYRPVAPICLEEHAPQIFDPGTHDPYMLFDHMVKEEWQNRVPAICHLDGSARLQTINKENNALMFSLLTEFYQISGIPLLCNTSANLNGSGFFPDVESAMQWGRLNYIWSDGYMYSKIDKNDLASYLFTPEIIAK